MWALNSRWPLGKHDLHNMQTPCTQTFSNCAITTSESGIIMMTVISLKLSSKSFKSPPFWLHSFQNIFLPTWFIKMEKWLQLFNVSVRCFPGAWDIFVPFRRMHNSFGMLLFSIEKVLNTYQSPPYFLYIYLQSLHWNFMLDISIDQIPTRKAETFLSI
jgi:hypothetical protein